MTIVIIYIFSAIMIYICAYKIIRNIDKKERIKLNNWEFSTLKEVQEILSKIYSEIPENITLGQIVEYVENEKSEINEKEKKL